MIRSSRLWGTLLVVQMFLPLSELQEFSVCRAQPEEKGGKVLPLSTDYVGKGGAGVFPTSVRW